MIANFTNPASLVVTAKENMWVNGISIFREMSAAYTNYSAKEFEGFGRDVGVALAMVFVG